MRSADKEDAIRRDGARRFDVLRSRPDACSARILGGDRTWRDGPARFAAPGRPCLNRPIPGSDRCRVHASDDLIFAADHGAMLASDRVDLELALSDWARPYEQVVRATFAIGAANIAYDETVREARRVREEAIEAARRVVR